MAIVDLALGKFESHFVVYDLEEKGDGKGVGISRPFVDGTVLVGMGRSRVLFGVGRGFRRRLACLLVCWLWL